MKKTTYDNPNLGSHWLTIKLLNIPGVIKYYQHRPLDILSDESFIISTYSHSITRIIIYENGSVVYQFLSRPDLIEQLNEQQLFNVTRYLSKLGWRNVTTSWDDQPVAEATLGFKVGMDEHTLA